MAILPNGVSNSRRVAGVGVPLLAFPSGWWILSCSVDLAAGGEVMAVLSSLPSSRSVGAAADQMHVPLRGQLGQQLL